MGDRSDWPKWLHSASRMDKDELGAVFLMDAGAFDNDPRVAIQTLEGKMLMSWGDMIIRGVAGELYSCNYDIFCQTYEKVEGD